MENGTFRSKPKNLVVFQKETDKGPKINEKSAPEKFIIFCDAFVIFTAVKCKEIPCGTNLDITRLVQIFCKVFYLR